MRYFVKTLSGEKGPYEVAEIAESLRAGRLKKDTLLRPEDGTTTVSAEEVVPRDGTLPASDEGARRRGRRAPGDVYAPPDEDGGDEAAVQNKGSFGQGFALGFFCGCVGLIYSLFSREMGSETKRGVVTGFIVQLVLGVIRLLVVAASQK